MRLVTLSVLLVGLAPFASAYQFIEFVNNQGQLVGLRWPSSESPVGYFVNAAEGNLTEAQAVAAVQASFQTWNDVETADIAFEFRGTTQAPPFQFFDFINTLGFLDDPEIQGQGILGATSWVVDIRNGDIAEADIFFNNEFTWSVESIGQPGRFDFQSVVTHEIGHFFGLGHSGLGVMDTSGGNRRLQVGSAIMFPFAFPPGSVVGRTLTLDDVTAISVLYPAAGYLSARGTLTGRVTKNSQGVAFAHVVTFNPFTSETISFFADESGNFEVRGLRPGPHVVRVNPIGDPTSPPDFGFPEQLTDLDFRDALYDGRAEVQASGTTSGINVEVTP